MDLLGDDYPYSNTALKGKHALVCGASKGIGRATAMMMAKAGANVTVCARNAASLATLCDELSHLGGGEHAPLALDLEDQDAIQSAIPLLLAERGMVHVLVNNAAGPPGGPLLARGYACVATAVGRLSGPQRGCVRRFRPAAELKKVLWLFSSLSGSEEVKSKL